MNDLDQIHDQLPFSSQSVNQLLKLKATGQPITISFNGRDPLVITDEGTFQLLLELVDRIDLTEVLRERLKSLDDGEPTLSLEEVREMARTRYGIPH